MFFSLKPGYVKRFYDFMVFVSVSVRHSLKNILLKNGFFSITVSVTSNLMAKCMDSVYTDTHTKSRVLI